MFNYDEQLSNSVNRFVSLPDGSWAERNLSFINFDDTVRAQAHLYFYVPYLDSVDPQPQVIDLKVMRNGKEPYFKDFVNFDGAWRDELGRYSTDINDLLPFDDAPLISFEDDSDIFEFEIKSTEG